MLLEMEFCETLTASVTVYNLHIFSCDVHI